jgi:hypothetical protein
LQIIFFINHLFIGNYLIINEISFLLIILREKNNSPKTLAVWGYQPKPLVKSVLDSRLAQTGMMEAVRIFQTITQHPVEGRMREEQGAQGDHDFLVKY